MYVMDVRVIFWGIKIIKKEKMYVYVSDNLFTS